MGKILNEIGDGSDQLTREVSSRQQANKRT
jgi:hypothetical protein